MAQTMTTVYTRATRAAVRAAILRLPQEVCTGGSGGVGGALLTRIGLTVLGRIREAFVVKARGGTDEAGDKWAPLKPSTIAYSRTRSRGAGGRTSTERGRDSRPSQALTTAQQERWWNLYRQGLVFLKGDKGAAAKRAWGILKREGAVTLLDKYGHRQVEILRDTGLLLNSLTPGSGSAEQVFRVGPGRVTIGTNRKGAAAHHSGVPGRLPQRRLWPEVHKWPHSWWADVVEQTRGGMVDIAVQLVKDAR